MDPGNGVFRHQETDAKQSVRRSNNPTTREQIQPDSKAFASLPKAYYLDYLSQDVSNYRHV
jgi:hypothetical protein